MKSLRPRDVEQILKDHKALHREGLLTASRFAPSSHVEGEVTEGWILAWQCNVGLAVAKASEVHRDAVRTFFSALSCKWAAEDAKADLPRQPRYSSGRQEDWIEAVSARKEYDSLRHSHLYKAGLVVLKNEMEARGLRPLPQ